MTKQNLAQFLTYAGALPFVICVAFSILSSNFLGLNYSHIVMTYGVVIVCFISGIHWGVYLFKDAHINLFVHSNIITLIAWSTLVFDLPYTPFILVLCFGWLLYIDKRLANMGILEDWYIKLRVNISMIVMITLAIFAVFHLL